MASYNLKPVRRVVAQVDPKTGESAAIFDDPVPATRLPFNDSMRAVHCILLCFKLFQMDLTEWNDFGFGGR